MHLHSSILFSLLLITTTFVCGTKLNKRHIHNQHLVKHKKLAQTQLTSNHEFFLRCPKIPQSNQKTHINVAWIHNKRTVFSVINGKIGHSFESNVTVKRWQTLSGQLNILANTSRHQFEYEERRNWYTLRIKRLNKEDSGIWKCRMVVWFEDKKIARRYESRKKMQMGNTTEFFTFKKRNLSDVDDNENPVIFTKANAEFTVFSRMSRFNDVAYIRNPGIIDKYEDVPSQSMSHKEIKHTKAKHKQSTSLSNSHNNKLSYFIPLLFVLFINEFY